MMNVKYKKLLDLQGRFLPPPYFLHISGRILQLQANGVALGLPVTVANIPTGGSPQDGGVSCAEYLKLAANNFPYVVESLQKIMEICENPANRGAKSALEVADLLDSIRLLTKEQNDT